MKTDSRQAGMTAHLLSNTNVINKIKNLVNLVNPVKKRKISVLICVYLWPNVFLVSIISLSALWFYFTAFSGLINILR